MKSTGIKLLAAMSAALLLAGAAFASAEVPADAQAWPGPDDIQTFEDLSFMANGSGLDYAEGHLYSVDNSPGRLYQMDVADDGTVTFSASWENGKCVYFVGGTGVPDTEGVTAAGDGYVYLASERDSENGNVNYNAILQVDPEEEGDTLTALQQWDITDFLPDARANKGIEAVEWVSVDAVEGLLPDDNTDAAFAAAEYPDMISGGVFFVGFETNGHVYAFVLNGDGTAVLLQDIDTGLGGIMALDYDEQAGILWACADSAHSNIATLLPMRDITDMTYLTPAGMDMTTHNEGFAIGEEIDGLLPVYHIADGLTQGALSVTWLQADYAEQF